MANSDVDEFDLIKQAIDGDESAMHALLTMHRSRLVKYITHNLPTELHSYTDSNDVLQDVFFSASRQIGKFENKGSDCFHRWMVTIARNRIKDLVRAKRSRQKRSGSGTGSGEERYEALIEQLASHRRTPSKSAAAHELMAAVERGLLLIQADYRQAITLRHFQGLSVSETAEKMALRPEDVSVLCCRGFKALREQLQSMSIYV